MPLGFQIRVGKQYCCGHNLPLWGRIGLAELPNFSLCDTDWTVNDVVLEWKIPLQITTSLIV